MVVEDNIEKGLEETFEGRSEASRGHVVRMTKQRVRRASVDASHEDDHCLRAVIEHLRVNDAAGTQTRADHPDATVVGMPELRLG